MNQMEFVKSYGGREKYFKRLNVKDCVVRAICHATGEDYLYIYNQMKEELIQYNIKHKRHNTKKRSPRNGFPTSLTKDFIEKNLGWKWVPLKTNINEEDFSKGIYLIQMNHHLTCIKDNVLYDSWDCQKKKDTSMTGYWIKE